MKLLARSEEILLLVIWRLQDDAYGVPIRTHVSEATGYAWTLGAIYAPLQRLEKKGYVTTHKSEPTAERGGRCKVFYRLTPKGKQALLAIKQVQETLWVGIPALRLDRQ